MSQISEKNSEHEKRDKKIEMLIEALQRYINELKQLNSGYYHNEADTYKKQIKTERERADVAEANLKQTSYELKKTQKEASELKKSQNELKSLKSTVQKMEDALTKLQNEHKHKIEQYTKEIQQSKSLYDAEKVNTEQLLAKLQEKSEETLTAKKSQEELQAIVKELKEALKQSESKHGSNETEIQQYKSWYTDEKENNAKMQETLTEVSARLQEKAKEASIARKSQESLQSTVKELEDALKRSMNENGNTEYNKEKQQYKDLYDTEKKNTVKAQEKLAQISIELQEKNKENSSLQESIQSIEKQLQGITKQYDLHIKEMEDKNKCLQAEKEIANERHSALQNTFTLLIKENQHLESFIINLQDEIGILNGADKEQNIQLLRNSDDIDMLKNINKEQDRQLLEKSEDQAHSHKEAAAKAHNIAKSPTKLQPMENQSTEVLTKTHSTENHATVSP